MKEKIKKEVEEAMIKKYGDVRFSFISSRIACNDAIDLAISKTVERIEKFLEDKEKEDPNVAFCYRCSTELKEFLRGLKNGHSDTSNQ